MNIEVLEENVWHLVLYQFHEDFALQLLVAGIVISFVLSFAVGANDSANSWGTSVGAGTVSLGWAYFLGSIMEILGATLLSGDVIHKVVNGIVNIDAYKSNRTEIVGNWSPEHVEDHLDEERLLVIGCMSVMLGGGLWQLVASWFSWPVAGTHCIIFGLLGFTVTAKGSDGIKNIEELVTIIYMLLVSILASMVVTAMFYYPLYRFCIRSTNPFSKRNRLVYGTLTGFSVGIPVSFILLQSQRHFDLFGAYSFTNKSTPIYIILGIGLFVALVVSVFAVLYLIPRLINMEGDFALNFDPRKLWRRVRKRGAPSLEVNGKLETELQTQESNGVATVPLEAEEAERPEGRDSPEITRIFRPLQVISAMTSALVHGGNDVANCIGPFVVIYLVFKKGIIAESSYESPWYISLWGGAGISLGLILYGKKVIMTMGSGISEMTPSRGFCVEWVASLVGLVFTVVGLLISTTHCKVGGLIGAGLMQGLVETGSPRKALGYVNFKVLSGVFLSWILTIPVSFCLSSLMFIILKAVCM